MKYINWVGVVLCFISFLFFNDINYLFNELGYSLDSGQYIVLNIGLCLFLYGKIDNLSRLLYLLFSFRIIDELAEDSIVDIKDIVELTMIIGMAFKNFKKK